MGGFGSGRWGSHSKRYTKENSLTLDLNFILKHGGLEPRTGTVHWSRNDKEFASIHYEIRRTFEGKFRLNLDYQNNGESVFESIELVSTPQNLGGERYWMCCPLICNGIPCNKRRSKLYSPPGCKYFGCRDCLDLTYESSQESHKYDRVFSQFASDTSSTLEMVKRMFDGIKKRSKERSK